MSKQSDLRKQLKKGDGLNALVSQDIKEANGLAEDPSENRKEPIENIDEPSLKINLTDPNEEDLERIQSLVEGRKDYFVGWKANTFNLESLQASFKKGARITFRIDYGASKIISQLKAPYTFEVITFDVRNGQSERLYGFSEKHCINSENFQISYTVRAHLIGLFQYRVISSVENTEIFNILEGNNFQVT